MRITQSMMSRNYMKSLNRNLGNLNGSNQKLTSGRSFTKMSENVAAGARALKVREQQYKNEQSLENMSEASSELASAESNLMSINEIVQSAQEKLLSAMSGTSDTSKREIIAKEIDKIKEQLLQFANAQFADKYQFGGTNNGMPPFAVGDDGKLTYNGVPVDEIYKDNTDGKYYYDVPAQTPGDPAVKTEIPMSDDIYIDVGLGLTMSGADVDPKTAFKISFNGLDILGFGTNDDGEPNNLYNLLDEIAKAINPDDPADYDKDRVSALKDHLKAQREHLMLNVTDIGTRSSFLEKTVDRLESDSVNLAELRNKLEAVDDTTEAMNMKMYQYAWLASLQFGSKILPQSLMDFMS